jgi:serine/threonine protein kinase/tetratricopeptide (TPR) repeat protein
MPADPAAVKALFLEAAELPPADRAALLAEKCGADADLLRRVNALLAAHDQAGGGDNTASFTASQFAANQTAGDGTRSLTPSAEAAGQVIAGRYKLVERIGEGGMGSVWMAEQTEPVKRKVAVKLIKAGLDSKTVLARFEAVRQALALMDHPNIAKVLDGGVHDGSPYFVMELVKGVPITEFCDARRLTPQQRLELFVPVCQAIQHAHQKGVIHRDIKPANVLVALYDDKPVPKVIDFGVAKATGPTLTEHTLNTGFGGVVGTPQYMSPEQATFNNLDIDTRSDVYSLGVLLYELLVGSPPFANAELKKRGLLEILRVVREEEPPKPSTKLSTADALPSLAANRGTEPKKLTGLLRNELDWIVMKALEKDRTRRYETANGFAADVLRYLAGEPVIAHPPTAAYRLKKFVRRNRPQVIASSVVLLALVAGVVGTTVGLLEAKRQEGIARDETTKKDAALVEEQRQRGIAEANERAATVAKEEEAKQRAAAVAEKKKAIEFRDKALDAIRATTGTDVEKLLGEKKELSANERAYLEAIAGRWQAFAKREGTDEQSRAIRAEGHFRVALLWQKLRRLDEARPEYEQGLAIQEKLAAEFPAEPAYRQNLALSHTNLGALLADLGKRAEAEEQYRKGLVIQGTLAADFPAVPDYRTELARIHTNLGVLLAGLGNRAEAEEQYRKGLAIREKLAAEFPAVPAYRSDLAASHGNLGNLLVGLGKRTEAEKQYRQGLAIRERLATEFPAVPVYRSELARSHGNLGNLLVGLGNRAEAEEQYRKGLVIREKLVAEFPTVPAYRQNLALSHNNLGTLLDDLGKRTEAEEQYRQGLAIRGKLATDFPAVPDYRVNLGVSYCNLGILIQDGGQPAESLEWFDRAIATLRPVHEAEPRAVIARQFLRNSHAGRANSYDRLRKFAEAVKDWDRAIELSPKQDQPHHRASRATSKLNAGMVSEAVAEVAELRKQPKWGATQLYDFACVYSVASAKIADKKAEYADSAMELLREAVKAGWKDHAHMKKDADLDPLRERDDFRKLLAELEAKFPPKREVLPTPRRE